MTNILPSPLARLYEKHRQLVIYCVIGVSGATLDFIVYLLLHYALHIPPAPASFISVSVGIVNNYILNVLFNFKVRSRLVHRFVNFYLVGVVGALFSSLLIFILFDIFGVNAVIAKLISIPFVVLLQFSLNRKYSFQQDFGASFIHMLGKFLRTKKLLVIINVVFLLACLVFVKAIPYPGAGAKGGPDELTHYTYNVQFMLEHKRLPVSGKDDLTAYKTCHPNDYGRVSCTYSYVVYPPFNYIVSAITASAAHHLTGVSYVKGARLASVGWGLVFVNALYVSLSWLIGGRKLAALLTATVVFIPQLIFTFSYTNQDAHSLGISALAFAAILYLLRTGGSRASIIFAGIAIGGLLPLAKYNYFVLILPLVVIALVGVKGKYIASRTLWRAIVAAVISFCILALPWYIRNYVLYHDFLGQTFMLNEMARYAPPGTAHSLSLATLGTFTRLGFFNVLFNSFFVAFGYMLYFLDPAYYTVMQAVLLGVVFYIIYIIANQASKLKQRQLLWLSTAVLLFIFLVIGVAFWNAAYYDYQAQGRYIYPILPVIAIGVAAAYRIEKRLVYVFPALAFVTAFAALNALQVFIGAYL